jgi:hypothetical protein
MYKFNHQNCGSTVLATGLQMLGNAVWGDRDGSTKEGKLGLTGHV